MYAYVSSILTVIMWGAKKRLRYPIPLVRLQKSRKKKNRNTFIHQPRLVRKEKSGARGLEYGPRRPPGPASE